MQEIFECIKAKMYIAALNDECLPIVCAVYKSHEFLFDVNYENDDRLKAEIENRLQEHLSGEHLDQLVELMTGVLKSVLLPASTTSPPTTATSKESVQQMHVFYANRSLLRIDYYVHRLTQAGKKALFFDIQVGVIDTERVRWPVMIYELSRATKGDEIKEVGEKLKRDADSKILLNEAARTIVKAARGDSTLRPKPSQPGPVFCWKCLRRWIPLIVKYCVKRCITMVILWIGLKVILKCKTDLSLSSCSLAPLDPTTRKSRLLFIDIFGINSLSIAVFMYSYHRNLLSVTFQCFLTTGGQFHQYNTPTAFRYRSRFVELILKNSVFLIGDLKSGIVYTIVRFPSISIF